MSYVMVAVGVGNAVTAIGGGKASRIQAETEAMQAEYQAKIEEQNGIKLAELIRKAGRAQLGQTRTAYAGAGVVVGEGSAGEAERAVIEGYEGDAHQALLDSWRRGQGLRTQATMARIGGKAAEKASYGAALSSLAQGAYQGYSGWKTGKTGRVTQTDLDAANASSDPIGELNKRKGWT